VRSLLTKCGRHQTALQDYCVALENGLHLPICASGERCCRHCRQDAHKKKLRAFHATLVSDLEMKLCVPLSFRSSSPQPTGPVPVEREQFRCGSSF
jgi:hypothetical protein